MLSLSERALGPKSSCQDSITFLMSAQLLHTLQSDGTDGLVEQIKEQISSTGTKLHGLHMLEFALQQNPEIYFKAGWTSALYDTLKEPVSCDNKEKACKILSLIISILGKDRVGNLDEIKRFVTTICPFLLHTAKSNLEWREAAFECLSLAVKTFPSAFDAHKEELLKMVIQQTNMVSSKNFEMFADCFSYLPSIDAFVSPKSYQNSWSYQYKRTLNTLNLILNNLLNSFPEVKTVEEIDRQDCGIHEFDCEAIDDFDSRFRQVRQFINLCKCLTKMLSTKSKHPVEVPIEKTLDCVGRLFAVDHIIKLNPNSMDNQIILSTLCQLQIAALTLTEPLLINFNSMLYSHFVYEMLKYAFKASVLPNVSKEAVSQIRHVLWKLIAAWICAKGSKSTFVVARDPFILKELLKDISISEKPVQAAELQAHGKSKKKTPLNVVNKYNYINSNWYSVCKEALKALKKIVYGGVSFINRKMTEEILSKVVHIAHSIHPSEDFPFPYTDEKCRNNLYKALLALTIVAKPAQIEALQCSISIFSNAIQDPSCKVRSVCCEAAAACRLALHPRKPPPLLNEPENTQRAEVPRKFTPSWSSEYPYIENIPPVEEVSEHVPQHSTQSFHPNDTEMLSSDYSQVDVHYSEQGSENQINGDDCLEIQLTSQCQEVEDSEEEEEEEEEDEEEDEDEEDEEEDVQLDATPFDIPETVLDSPEEPELLEYEELRPSGSKHSQANSLSNSNTKNVYLNGVHNSVPDEEPSVSAVENVTNENGIYISEEEEMENDDDGEDEREEDDEEISASYPAEKRVPEFFETSSPKKPKLDVEYDASMDSQNDEAEERKISASLGDMISDFDFSDVEGLIA